MQELKIKGNTLAAAVETVIKEYLRLTDKNAISNLYGLLLEQIEPPLLKAVMEYCRYNKSLAAKTLGISRGPFREKLIKYFNNQYYGS